MNTCIVFTATKYHGHYSMKRNSFCLEISYYMNTPDHKKQQSNWMDSFALVDQNGKNTLLWLISATICNGHKTDH